jgi:hypothetical protein
MWRIKAAVAKQAAANFEGSLKVAMVIGAVVAMAAARGTAA